jgi:hypothetical protein
MAPQSCRCTADFRNFERAATRMIINRCDLWSMQAERFSKASAMQIPASTSNSWLLRFERDYVQESLLPAEYCKGTGLTMLTSENSIADEYLTSHNVWMYELLAKFRLRVGEEYPQLTGTSKEGQDTSCRLGLGVRSSWVESTRLQYLVSE